MFNPVQNSSMSHSYIILVILHNIIDTYELYIVIYVFNHFVLNFEWNKGSGINFRYIYI